MRLFTPWLREEDGMMAAEQTISDADAVDEPHNEHIIELSTDSAEGSSSASMRSSPPVAEVDEETVTDDPSVTSKKRSHEKMDAEQNQASQFPSSVTMVGDPTSSAMLAAESQEPPPSVKPSAAAHTSMAPPQVPASCIPTEMFQTAQSTQAPQKPKSMPPPPPKPQSKQREKAPSPESLEAPGSEDEESMSSEPHDKIEDFAWDDLEQRYHDRMTELGNQEHMVMNEFNGLCNYFAIWADAGGKREVDRSFKRLKTQATYVQHEEDQLEERRLHYIKVVDAFKSALQLLGQP